MQDYTFVDMPYEIVEYLEYSKTIFMNISNLNCVKIKYTQV